MGAVIELYKRLTNRVRIECPYPILCMGGVYYGLGGITMKFKQQRTHKSKQSNPVAIQLLEEIKELEKRGNFERAKALKARYKKRYGNIPTEDKCLV